MDWDQVAHVSSCGFIGDGFHELLDGDVGEDEYGDGGIDEAKDNDFDYQQGRPQHGNGVEDDDDYGDDDVNDADDGVGDDDDLLVVSIVQPALLNPLPGLRVQRWVVNLFEIYQL